MKPTTKLTFLIVAFIFSANTLAQKESTAEDSVQQRQAVFHLMGFAKKPVVSMVQSGEVDKEAAKLAYHRIVVLSEMIPELFEADTRQSGIDSRAKDTIWDQQHDFSVYAERLTDAAREAIEAIENDESLRDVMRSVGGTCGDCHGVFRN